MPGVLLEMEIQAPADRVWESVVDIERYPESMENVRWVKILEHEEPNVRKTAWSVNLKGSILEWHDRETLDHVARTMRFRQLSGDMEVFTGSWELTELAPELTALLTIA